MTNIPAHKDRLLTNRPRELWVDIPGLDGAYQISNFGRIKSIRKWVQRATYGYWLAEKILKCDIRIQKVSDSKRKIFHLHIGIKYEGKVHSISIARLVYWLFVKKFDIESREVTVSFKDENNLNINPANLILTTPSKTIKKAYEKNHRPRKSFGKKAQPVSQYDSTGKWLCTYPSVSVAAKATDINLPTLVESLNHRNSYTGGYLWKYGNKQENLHPIPKAALKVIELERLYSTIVTQYDMQGIKIKEYQNLKAAAIAVEIQPNSIRRVILGSLPTAGGYYWISGNGPENIVVPEKVKRKCYLLEIYLQPITQYDKQGNRIAIYASVKEAAAKTNIQLPMMINILTGKHLSGKGYYWLLGQGKERMNVDEFLKMRRVLKTLKPVVKLKVELR